MKKNSLKKLFFWNTVEPRNSEQQNSGKIRIALTDVFLLTKLDLNQIQLCTIEITQ